MHQSAMQPIEAFRIGRGTPAPGLDRLQPRLVGGKQIGEHEGDAEDRRRQDRDGGARWGRPGMRAS